MTGHGITINMSNLLHPGQDMNPSTMTDKKSLYAGGLNMGDSPRSESNPLIEQKRRLAGKQAMKLIRDAWDRDNQSAQSVKDMEQKKDEKRSERNELCKKIGEIEEQKATLQKEYGVAPDSQEQKDLELLQKYQDNKNGASYDEFSEEELARLGELASMERTEYQKRVLELNDTKDLYMVNAEKAGNEVIALTESISDAKINQLKSQDMQNATEAAGEIMDALSDEIIGMLIQDAKENIDEKQEEALEKAKEEAEKKEELDERVEEAREKKQEQQELIEGAAESDQMDTDIQREHTSDSAMKEAQANIQRILEENNLINEDIKGLNIDLGF